MSIILLAACVGGIVRYKKRNSNKSESSSEASVQEEQRVMYATSQAEPTVIQQVHSVFRKYC